MFSTVASQTLGCYYVDPKNTVINFDNVLGSEMLSVQIVLGASWNDLMFRSVNALKDVYGTAGATWFAVTFFSCYFIVDVLLLTNMWLSILIEAYSESLRKGKDGRKWKDDDAGVNPAISFDGNEVQHGGDHSKYTVEVGSEGKGNISAESLVKRAVAADSNLKRAKSGHAKTRQWLSSVLAARAAARTEEQTKTLAQSKLQGMVEQFEADAASLLSSPSFEVFFAFLVA